MISNKKKILFIDRDGTLIEEPEDKQIDSLSKLKLLKHVVPALLKLKKFGYEFVMVSNQDGLGTKSFPQADFQAPHDMLIEILSSQGIDFSEILICPHLPEDKCGCRKPNIGLVNSYLFEQKLDMENSFVIGDRATDAQLAVNMGIGHYLIPPAGKTGWEDVLRSIEAHLGRDRRAEINRNTKETQIKIKLNLDQKTPVKISTGLGFYDHMLEQVAHHGGFSLEIEMNGDLEIDEHHTVEDVALALGEGLCLALADRRGIERFSFVLPMDEAQSQVAIDLGGRPYMVFDGKFPREMVGDLPCELVPHFFRSLSESLKASIHLKVEGENTHHMVESLFKGLGRCLRQAVKRDLSGDVPSTKGQL